MFAIFCAHDAVAAKRIHPWVVSLVPVLSVLSSLAHAQQVSALRVDYVRTVTDVSGDTETVEHGRHFISEDGFRTRVDRIRNGESTSEIVRPDASDPDGHAAERLRLNFATREATVEPERYIRPLGSSAPVLFSPEEAADMPANWLGYRTVGALVLSGFRVIDRGDGDTLDLWHAAGSPIAGTIEERSATPDGIVEEERVIAVEHVRVDESLFGVPDDWRVRRRAPWLVGNRLRATSQPAGVAGNAFRLDATAAGMDFSAARRTLVVAIQQDCPFCAASMPFYRRLTERAASDARVRIVVAAPPRDVEIERDLAAQGVEADAVVRYTADTLPMSATPTLLLVDAAGFVEHFWVGALSPVEEQDVVTAVFSGS